MTSPIKHATIIRVTEAAKLLKCSKSTARRLANDGILRPIARTQGRHRRFTREEVLRVRAMLLERNTDEVRASRIAKQRQTRAASRVLKDAKRWQRIAKWMIDHCVEDPEYGDNATVYDEALSGFVWSLVPADLRRKLDRIQEERTREPDEPTP